MADALAWLTIGIAAAMPLVLLCPRRWLEMMFALPDSDGVGASSETHRKEARDAPLTHP